MVGGEFVGQSGSRICSQIQAAMHPPPAAQPLVVVNGRFRCGRRTAVQGIWSRTYGKELFASLTELFISLLNPSAGRSEIPTNDMSKRWLDMVKSGVPYLLDSMNDRISHFILTPFLLSREPFNAEIEDGSRVIIVP